MYLNLEGVFTRILSVISDRTPFKLLFVFFKGTMSAHITHLNSGVGPARSRDADDVIRTRCLSPYLTASL